MSIFANLFEQRTEQGNLTDSRVVELVLNYLGGGPTASGMRVSPMGAMALSAVFACYRVLCESIGSLPWLVYRRLPGSGKERAADHYLYPVLHDAPNPDMTSQTYRETCVLHLCMHGNSFSEIIADGAGRVRELWPLDPERMTLKRDRDDRLVYEYRDPKRGLQSFQASKILHIPALSMNGILGISPTRQAGEAIGLGLALQEFAARFFGNGALPGIILEYPGKFKDKEASKNIRDSWNEIHQGASNAHGVAVLEEGMKANKVGVEPEHAQMLQSRTFQLREVARPFRVQPHLIGDLEHATFSNIEHQGLEFVVHTLRPWLTRFEQAVQTKLLLPAERTQFFSEFLVDGLLRGDVASRYNAYSVGRQWGWLSRNEIRERENMNPIEGGDRYLTPLNMTEAETDDPERQALIEDVTTFLMRNRQPAAEGNGRH